MLREQVDAIYEHGVLRPLRPLSLAESQRVNLTISDSSQSDSKFLDELRAEVAAMRHLPTLEEVHQVMSKIPGSLADDIIAERGDW